MKTADTDSNVIPLSRRQTELIKQIDDAYWYGDTEAAPFLQTQLDYGDDLLEKGELWYPRF